MITIKKGENVFKVSKAAYKDMFKNMGYDIVEETISTPNIEDEEVVEETKNEEILDIEEDEEVVEETKNSKTKKK